MYIPLYFKLTEDNFLFLRPDRQSGFIMMCYTLLQLVTIYVQKNKPRFLLTQGLRGYLASGFYRYERGFDEEAS
jgi:hypothetical protein